MKPAVTKAINEQINKELFSGYLYLSMASYFADEDLPGFAHWMTQHAQEEAEHAFKMIEFLHEQGERVQLEAIDKPKHRFDSPVAVFEEALEHEQMVTGLINQLYELAQDEKDHASAIFLQWYVTEQVEEEATFSEILENLRRAGSSGHALFMLDRQLGSRE